MNLLDKIIIPYSFYEKSYIEETDTAIFKLCIKNNFYNVAIKITISNYCDTNKSFTSIEITSNDITQYFSDIGEKGNIEALIIAQNFLLINDLLLYIKGFGTPNLNKIFLEQSKPLTTNYESNYNNQDR